MDAKEIALLLSPLISVVVAVATVWFNAYDRKRHYAMEADKLKLERQKLAQDMAKALLNGTKSLERRIDLCNELMAHVSAITHEAQSSLSILGKSEIPTWNSERIISSLDELTEKVRGSQAFTTQFVHQAITREYAGAIAAMSSAVSGALALVPPRRNEAINHLTMMITTGDDLKIKIRSDLESFIRGLSNVQ